MNQYTTVTGILITSLPLKAQLNPCPIPGHNNKVRIKKEQNDTFLQQNYDITPYLLQVH